MSKSTDILKLPRAAVDSFVHMLWPGVCPICREGIGPGDKGLCPKCWQDLMACCSFDYCRRCGSTASKYGMHDGKCESCRSTQFHFDGIGRAGVYSKALAALVVAIKHDKTELLGHIRRLANSAFANCAFRDEIEFFVPVPLHWRRRLGRGYNQAQLIAKSLKDYAPINDDLARIRNTRIQPSLDFADRARNVAGAFAVRKGHAFAGRTLCLVDDTRTSGATLNECARILKDAGAKKVYAFVLAAAGDAAVSSER
jgi:competence protein ComFC